MAGPFRLSGTPPVATPAAVAELRRACPGCGLESTDEARLTALTAGSSVYLSCSISDDHALIDMPSILLTACITGSEPNEKCSSSVVAELVGVSMVTEAESVPKAEVDIASYARFGSSLGASLSQSADVKLGLASSEQDRGECSRCAEIASGR